MTESKFEKINGLKWLPWVGANFETLELKDRLLIIGESHYLSDVEGSAEKHDSETYTRRVIEELAIDRCYYGTRIFPNLHKTLFGHDKFNSKIFWNLVSYYNFIQRPMDSNKKRPGNSDYLKGWKTYLEIIKILKPKTCLFIGTSAANSLTKALENTGFSTDKIEWEDRISNTYGKTAILKDEDGNETKLIFIRHTSQMFSWEKWNEYLKKKMGSKLTWFESQIEK